MTVRDLDDALSCEKLANGNYKVGVHIADVSYVLCAPSHHGSFSIDVQTLSEGGHVSRQSSQGPRNHNLHGAGVLPHAAACALGASVQVC